MKAMINVGNKQSKKMVKDIVLILKTICKSNISDKVGVEALRTYTRIAEVKNVSISGCNLQTGKLDE